MSEHKVIAWGKPHTVTVDQKSKGVWVAVGDCLGEPITVQGRTKGAAIKRWCEPPAASERAQDDGESR
jgi:hypothetical protein